MDSSHSSILHRSSTIRKRFEPEDLQSWTSARCQRLLRQLQARLAALRKLKYQQQQFPERSVTSKRVPSQDVGRTSKRIRIMYSQRDRPSLPECAVTTPPRSRRTIGAMRLDHSSPLSGPADFRTPVWKRIRARMDTPIDASGQISVMPEDLASPEIPAHILEGMQTLQQSVPDAQYRLCEAMLEWFNGLLRSTTPRARQSHAKSLLSMCLRRVPACIASIEAWDRQQASKKHSSWNSSLVAFDIYDQLEEFGPESVGWRPLRLVIRSQSVSVLSDAISEGLFPPSFTSLLVRLCAHLNCEIEAARLASSVQGELPGPRTMKSSFREREHLQPLYALLLSYAEERASNSVFDCIATLMQGQRLPSAWLCTQGLSRLWASGLENMASDHAKPSVLRFMKAAMILLAQSSPALRKPDKCNTEQTLIGIAGGVTAVALTLETEMRTGRKARGERAWRRLIHLLEHSIAGIRRPGCRKGGPGNGLFILVAARCLAVIESCLADTSYRRQAVVEFETMVSSIVTSAKKDALYRQMILLICTIVQCRRRTCGIPSHDNLGEICSKIDQLCLPDWYVRAIRKDTAFMLAQKTKDLRDLAFAENLPTASDTSNISTIFSGWRWEEGISEWVLPNPEAGRSSTSKTRILKRQGLRSQTEKQVSRLATNRRSSLQTQRGQHGRTWSLNETNLAFKGSVTDGQRGAVVRTRLRPALAVLPQSGTAEDDRDDLL